jgi:hypothetical protein
MGSILSGFQVGKYLLKKFRQHLEKNTKRLNIKGWSLGKPEMLLRTDYIVFVEDFSFRLIMAPTQLITVENYPENGYHLYKHVD